MAHTPLGAQNRGRARPTQAHPVRSLPFSQLLRARRITAVEDRWAPTVVKMTNDFRQRGYPQSLVKRQIDKVNLMTCTQARASTCKSKEGHRIPFVSTFSDSSSHICQILRKHWGILKDSFTQIVEFHSPPVMAYRRGRSIKDSLVKSEVSTKPLSKQKFFGVRGVGTFPCLNCINCKIIEKGDSFVHPTSGKSYKIRNYYTCTSDWVVYILKCPCSLIYVGETTCDLKTRLNNHRFTIRKKRLDLPVSKHFAEKNHSEWDIKCVVIDSVPPLKRGGDRLMKLRKKELEWIFRLNSLRPHGLNVDFKTSAAMTG